MAEHAHSTTEFRALTLFSALPPGCIAHPVNNSMCEPHLHCGEFAVVDTNDREPQHGEAFLVQWMNGDRGVYQVTRRQHTGSDGPFEGWWTNNLAAGAVSKAQKDAIFRDIMNGCAPQASASAFISLCYADGPCPIEHFRKKLVGRVVGVLNSAEPQMGAVTEGGANV